MDYKPKKNHIQNRAFHPKHTILKKDKRGNSDRRCKYIPGFYFYGNSKA